MTEPVTVDPDNVPETLCVGKFNVSTSVGGLITFTFTHARPKAGPLLDAHRIDEENVVRARIVTTMENAVGLMNILESMRKQPSEPVGASARSSKPN